MTDINRFERNGKRYIAQLTETSRCTMCVFYGNDGTIDCWDSPPCSATFRSDGRDIIWAEEVKMDNRKTIREQRDESQWGFWLVILAVDLGLAYLWMYG